MGVMYIVSMETAPMKLRFELDTENQCYRVKARSKATGKWQQIGTCHLSAKAAVKMGQVELIQFNIEKGA